MAAEILAPAGSFEALVAAVRCGANAVYLGGKALNARRNASNFSDEELKKAVDYCHKRNVKVYLTLNTLVGDEELETAYEAIKRACESYADALILQDIGVASLAKSVAPSMPLHASTQMSVQSIQGVRTLEKLGFSRIVLPRELSEKELASIASQTDAELECFVHGALCMCVSGQCLMSSFLGGRSGNRGLCAQPCRLPFGVNGKGGCNLSLKDLSLIDELGRLEKAGVCSFKIEGRMKRPEYVAAAVTACKNSLCGIKDENISDSLRAVFSRSGFTKGYFEGKLGKDMFGTRRKEDVESASGVLSGLKRLYDNENPLIPVDFKLTFKKDEPMSLTACSSGKAVEIKSESSPSRAINKPLEKDELSARISKCGGTQFYADKIAIDYEPGLNAPASALNNLRREALCSLEEKLAERADMPVSDFSFKANKHNAGSFSFQARFFREEQIPEGLTGVSRAIVPIETSAEAVERLVHSGVETAVEIPAAVFSNAENYAEKLAVLKSHGASLAWICTLDGMGIAEKAGLPFASGFGMNVFNTLSVRRLEALGARDCLISCEINLNSAARLGGSVPRGAIIYGRIPLMLTRNCPVKNRLNCAECGSSSKLVDRMGIEFPVICKNGASFILNSRPLSLADKVGELRGIDFGLVYFTNESAEECKKILDEIREGKSPQGEFTRGLYYKNVF